MVQNKSDHNTNNLREVSIVNDLVCTTTERQRDFHENFFRLGNPRKDQDLGEEEYHEFHDDDAQRSNNSDENNNQDNDASNYRGS